MAVTYDPKIIEQFSEALYARAARIILYCGISFAFTGAIVGAVLGARGGLSGVYAVVFAVIGGAFGLSYGKAKAFSLRLEAQKALCQVEIEKNTRKSEA